MKIRSLFKTTLLAASVAIATTGIAYGDDDEWGEYSEGFRRGNDVPAVTNQNYKTECGACHFAYQPGWLPARSWRSLMDGLQNHFGENAELDNKTRDLLTDYLVVNAADSVSSRQSRRILRSLGGNDAPLRISNLAFLKREHDEIPSRMVSGNPKVRSLSHCQACHTQAEKGIFDEHGINIPGYGYWDD